MAKTWARHKTTETALNNGWRLAAVGGWRRLVVGGGWWLVAVGGWWRLVVGGGWRLTVGGPWGYPSQKKKWGFQRTASPIKDRPALGHDESAFPVDGTGIPSRRCPSQLQTAPAFPRNDVHGHHRAMHTPLHRTQRRTHPGPTHSRQYRNGRGRSRQRCRLVHRATKSETPSPKARLGVLLSSLNLPRL